MRNLTMPNVKKKSANKAKREMTLCNSHNYINISNVRRNCNEKNEIMSQISYDLTIHSVYTECPKIYRKALLHLLKYRFAVYLTRCSTDLR